MAKKIKSNKLNMKHFIINIVDHGKDTDDTETIQTDNYNDLFNQIRNNPKLKEKSYFIVQSHHMWDPLPVDFEHLTNELTLLPLNSPHLSKTSQPLSNLTPLLPTSPNDTTSIFISDTNLNYFLSQPEEKGDYLIQNSEFLKHLSVEIDHFINTYSTHLDEIKLNNLVNRIEWLLKFGNLSESQRHMFHQYMIKISTLPIQTPVTHEIVHQNLKDIFEEIIG